MSRSRKQGKGASWLLLFSLFLILTLLPSGQQKARRTPSRVGETVELVEMVYLDSRVDSAVLLYEPCYVLALADLRPEGGWSGHFEISDEEIGILDTLLGRHGYRVSLEDGNLWVMSLRGLARESKRSRFEWLPEPYDVDSSWAGWDRWFLEAENASREYGLNEHYIYGIRFGYPDSAIQGFIGSRVDPIRIDRAIQASIPYSTYLDNGSPSFSFLPEDLNSPDIREVCAEWGKFLKAFYESPQIARRLECESFQRQRKKFRSSVRYSPDEAWRAGIEPASDLQFQAPYFRQLTMADERVLKDSIDALESIILRGEPPYEWLTFLQRQNLANGYGGWITPSKIKEWIWYGAYGTVPHRHRLFSAVNRSKPEYLNQVYQKKLDEILASPQEISDREFQFRLLALKRHPYFPEFYQTLGEVKKNRLRTLLEGLATDTGGRE